jgi:hypothetical protein
MKHGVGGEKSDYLCGSAYVEISASPGLCGNCPDRAGPREPVLLKELPLAGSRRPASPLAAVCGGFYFFTPRAALAPIRGAFAPDPKGR